MPRAVRFDGTTSLSADSASLVTRAGRTSPTSATPSPVPWTASPHTPSVLRPAAAHPSTRAPMMSRLNFPPLDVEAPAQAPGAAATSHRRKGTRKASHRDPARSTDTGPEARPRLGASFSLPDLKLLSNRALVVGHGDNPLPYFEPSAQPLATPSSTTQLVDHGNVGAAVGSDASLLRLPAAARQADQQRYTERLAARPTRRRHDPNEPWPPHRPMKDPVAQGFARSSTADFRTGGISADRAEWSARYGAYPVETNPARMALHEVHRTRVTHARASAGAGAGLLTMPQTQQVFSGVMLSRPVGAVHEARTLLAEPRTDASKRPTDAELAALRASGALAPYMPPSGGSPDERW